MWNVNVYCYIIEYILFTKVLARNSLTWISKKFAGIYQITGVCDFNARACLTVQYMVEGYPRFYKSVTQKFYSYEQT